MVYHQTGNILNVGFDFFHVLNHKECLEYIHIKAFFGVIWIQIIIIQGTGNNALMGVVQKLLQSVIKHMERHNRTGFFIHHTHGRLFEQCQHGTLSLCQVLTGCSMGTDGCQNTSQQVKLVWNERIYLCKVIPVCIQLFLHAIIKQDQILCNDLFFIII